MPPGVCFLGLIWAIGVTASKVSYRESYLFLLCVCVCVCVRERESGHDAGLMILFQNLKSSMQLLSCPTITVMTQHRPPPSSKHLEI